MAHQNLILLESAHDLSAITICCIPVDRGAHREISGRKVGAISMPMSNRWTGRQLAELIDQGGVWWVRPFAIPGVNIWDPIHICTRLRKIAHIPSAAKRRRLIRPVGISPRRRLQMLIQSDSMNGIPRKRHRSASTVPTVGLISWESPCGRLS